MAPNLVMVAFQASYGANPGKVLTLLKNLLELNGNKIYHWTSFVVWGGTPKCKRAVSSRKLTAQINLKTFLPTKSK